MPSAGIFDVVHSIPGDLVDLSVTRNGAFAFLEDLHETGRLWDLRNFRIPRLPGVGCCQAWDGGRSPAALLEARISGIASKLSSPLPSATPRNPSPYISSGLFARFLPALLVPGSRRGKPRHISINARRFQKGEWEAIWTQAFAA